MQFLRQSTASQEVLLGPFVDSTDGNTEETALTIANTDIKLWKTGATTLANKNSGGATHISNGEYYAVLDATDTDTIGPMIIRVHVAGALAVRLFCTVLDEAVYDALFGTVALATATNITSATGVTLAALTHTGAVIPTVTTLTNLPAITANWLTAAGIAADAITAAKLAPDVSTEIAAAVNTVPLVESYRANGAQGTLTQLLYEILAHLTEASIAGTTKTIKKIDHTTVAATATLDSATAPTSITRAT